MLLVAAIKQQDPNPNAINRNPDDINRLGNQLREEIDSLVPALMKTYDKVALEKMWSEVEDALKEQRDVATPAFLRELEKCPKPVHVAVALRSGSMIASQPLPAPKVLIAYNVMDADLVLKRSMLLDTTDSKMLALGAAMIGDAFGNVDVLPGHATPLYILSQTQNAFNHKRDSCNSLFWSRSGTMAALDPNTGQILFRTDRLDFGHPSIDAAYIQTHAIDAVTSGAYRDLCQLANADRGALLQAAAEEERKRTAHADKVASLLDEAYASGTCPNVVVFLAQADGAVAKGRAFANRDALEVSFASIGIPCLLLNSHLIHPSASLSKIDQVLRQAVPAHLRVCRNRSVVVYPEKHVYPEIRQLGHNLTVHLAKKGCVFSETVARAAFDDSTVLDDLDSPLLDPHRAFVKVDEPFLAKWRRENPGLASSCAPSVMFNAAAGFVSTADVSREAAEKRKAELGKVVAPGEFKLNDQSSRKKQPFDFEDYLKPNGVFDLARLKALKLNFEKQIKAAKDAKDPNKFKFDWWGESKGSKSNLSRTLNCSWFKSNGRGPTGPPGDYLKVLNKEIKKLETSTTG